MTGPKVFFTDRYTEVYPQISRVSYSLDFKNKIKNFQKLVKKLDIKNNDDYLKNMSEFAAVPAFLVSLQNNMPNFSYYEYRKANMNSWKKLKSSKLNWDAFKKINLLEVRAVNTFGRSGPITFLKLSYK